MVSDDMHVFIAGRDVGTLDVSTRSPKDTLRVMVSKPGTYRWKIVSVRQVKGEQQPRHMTLSSRLIINGREPLLVIYGNDDKMQPFLTPPLE
jgi:hypothetical protein